MRGPSSRPRRPTRLTAVHAPEGDGTDTPDTVLVVDFGAQYAQLIARRVRECQVYSEIVPASMPVAQMLARRPKAIILSGGPASVYAPGAPPAPVGVFQAGVPILGICYGFQLMASRLGGTVKRKSGGEHGAAGPCSTRSTVPPTRPRSRGFPAAQPVACSWACPPSSRCGCRTATRAPP